ncbi:myosin regulatory light chain, smooth muscle [Aricia agestis]|uniref:myosin regulatory light chain, smooth muscle n=1 Tax=Aricia agestis TaxID=91739 RepID=UPI001C201B2C|nr:myosin regulatory light chain, smooth muscle [Aricia agestis]
MEEPEVSLTIRPKKVKTEKKRESDASQDEIKQFKENLLQSLSTGATVLSDANDELTVPMVPRSRSASRARDALQIPPNVLAELDENKIFELKEAFLLFDMNGDGCIDFDDLRATLVSLGETIDEEAVKKMMAEASEPLDFDAFVNLLGYRTLELDSEETLVEALSRWDTHNTGYISEERIRHDLMTWGDRFTEKEADYALDEAPIIKKDGYNFIDYKQFCRKLCGLKKPNKDALKVV